MARISKLLDDLSVVLEGFEHDLFDTNSGKVYYNGIEFSKSDWRNLQNAVEQVKKTYERNNTNSKTYFKNNKEYNRLNRMIHYYKSKPVKKERDFVRLEKLQKKMEKCLDKREEEKRINTKLKLLEQKTQREKRKYAQKERSIEDEFN